MDNPCEEGLLCAWSIDPVVCSICLPYLREGQNCVEHLDFILICDEYSYCDTDSGFCVPDIAEGEVCASWFQCSQGHYCRSGICTAYLSRGAACGEQDRCNGLLSCVGGICTNGRSFGEPCDESNRCLPSLTCRREICENVDLCGDNTDGAPCGWNGHCASGYFCNQGECSSRREPGSPCHFASDCVDNAFCDFVNDVCVAYTGIGEPCDPGWCDYRTSFCDIRNEYICREHLDNGEYCEYAFECESDYCNVEENRCADTSSCRLPD